MTTRLLPKQFSALESFVPDWALPTEAERLAKLTRTSIVDLKAFYDANAALFKTPEEVNFEYVILTPDALSAEVAVTADEVKAQYAAQSKQFTQEEQRQAAHVLIAVKPDAPAADKAAAKKKAEDIFTQAKANPAKFAELAKQYSQDPGSAAQGGERILLQGCDILIEQGDQAARRLERQKQQAQQRGLAGAGGAGEKLERVGGDQEGEVAQNLRAEPVPQTDIFEPNQAQLRSTRAATGNPGLESEPGLAARCPLVWTRTGQNGFAAVMVSDSLTVAM